MTIQTILVPTDFSPSAEAAFRLAENFARHHGARIHLLHVVPVPLVDYAWDTESGALRIADLVEHLQQDARKRFTRVVARHGSGSGRIVNATTNGQVIPAILDYIRKHRIDLVVMGTHGRSAVERALVGSVADRLVRRSPVPVVVVPLPAARTGRRHAKHASRR